jgi:hypothetical protein
VKARLTGTPKVHEPDGARPSAGFLTGASDDYVVRVNLPGAVVHDCTLSQARVLELELQAAIAIAERAEQRDRRVLR